MLLFIRRIKLTDTNRVVFSPGFTFPELFGGLVILQNMWGLCFHVGESLTFFLPADVIRFLRRGLICHMWRSLGLISIPCALFFPDRIKIAL